MGRLEVEVETKSSADKIWEAIKETPTLFPKIFPDRYKSVEVLEGDGKNVGSVLLMNFVESTPGVTFSKDRIDEADEATKSLAYTVIEGEILAVYTTFKAKLQVVPKGDGSLVKWSLEYEKANEEVPEPNFIKDFATQTFKGLDAHFQN
ncbi:Mlp-like protein [Thalictrum thalictroides]|uniref:Mlp-like protein n=1 Tax=Thalictrum thalictroides TaxID=46969 RepID=A0A7J6WS94_THATH|nr:Mlp-like protein [Thalictrum thalictroides]